MVKIAIFHIELHSLAMRDLSTKKIKPNIEKWPENPGVLNSDYNISNEGYWRDILQNRFQHDRFGVTSEISVGPFYLQISLLNRK